MLRFDAPWSRSLTRISLLLVAIAAVMLAVGAWPGVVLLGAVLVLAGALAVRGYTVEPGAVIIHRPGWQTRLDLSGLESAEPDPTAMRRSIRTFGIGGPFALVGCFRSSRIGAFRAYATDPARAVVLRWPGRTVVVTPDDPASFATAVETAAERV